MQVHAKIDTPSDDNNNNMMMTDDNLRVRITQFYRWYPWGGACQGIIMFSSAFVPNNREREREIQRDKEREREKSRQNQRV